ncbi:Plasma membrane sulfite pump involved in sulfite metabolism [Ceratobasidium sp. 414]|nr:Plasma membrane sulfite pump involved in sulfite metabolism [Ceratobasidium sp. 414]
MLTPEVLKGGEPQRFKTLACQYPPEAKVMVQPDGVLDTSPPADINAREHPSYLPPDVDSIKIFMPSWFVANMGTGVVSSLLWSFPYGPRSILHTLGTVFLALNIILFAIFCVLSTIRSFQHPKLISLTLRHPVQSFYLGCLPMGFATIINTTLDINQNYGFGGESLLYTLWVLYAMVTRQNPTVKTPTVVWLLPAVTPIVPSTTGAFLARAILPHSTNHAILTLFMSTVLLFLGLSLAFMILPLHVLQLITEGLPKNTLVASKLLFVGPCGQGGATFIIIGQVFAEIGRRRLSDHILLSESQPWTPLGLACGFFLWTLGTWWVLPSISGVYEALRWDPPDVAPEFWGMVFPLLWTQLSSKDLPPP